MSFGLMVTADFFSSEQLASIAAQAQECGFDNLWVPEMFGRDPFITCATLLSATQTIHVGTAITNIYARDERAIKAAAYSLAESSGNRFELGIGVSNKMGNDQRGLPWLPPVKKLNSDGAPIPPTRVGTVKPATVLATKQTTMHEDLLADGGDDPAR